MSNDLEKYRYRPGHVLSVKAMVYGLSLGVCLVSVVSTLAMVPAGSRAVLFNNFTGIEPLSLTEGMHLIIPFVEHPVLYDVRTQTYTMSGVVDEGQKIGDDSVVARKHPCNRGALAKPQTKLQPCQLSALRLRVQPMTVGVFSPTDDGSGLTPDRAPSRQKSSQILGNRISALRYTDRMNECSYVHEGRYE